MKGNILYCRVFQISLLLLGYIPWGQNPQKEKHKVQTQKSRYII